MRKHLTQTVVDLLGVIVAVTKRTPRVLVVDRDDEVALPTGPFDPDAHARLEDGLRRLIEAEAGLDLYYVEQLYSFGNRYRTSDEIAGGPRRISVASSRLRGRRWAPEAASSASLIS